MTMRGRACMVIWRLGGAVTIPYVTTFLYSGIRSGRWHCPRTVKMQALCKRSQGSGMIELSGMYQNRDNSPYPSIARARGEPNIYITLQLHKYGNMGVWIFDGLPARPCDRGYGRNQIT